MTDSFRELIGAPGAANLVLATTLALKATMLLAVGGLIASLSRGAAAATRHLIWLAAIVAAVILPAFALTLPAWRVVTLPSAAAGSPLLSAIPEAISRPSEVGVPALAGTPVAAAVPRAAHESITPSRSSAASPDVVAMAGSTAESPSASEIAPVVAGAASSIPVVPINWARFALLAWAAGAIVVLLPLLAGILRVRFLARSARDLRDPRWTMLGVEVIRALGIRREVRFVESDSSPMPMTWGIRNPVVVLPSDAERWTERQRRDVLLHELAHVRRHDCLTQSIAHVACALYWFNPLVWVAARRLRVERELACDDAVLAGGARASEYAAHLLDVARTLRAPAVTSMAAVAMARRNQLSDRLLAVLDAHRSRGDVSPRLRVPVWAASVAVAAAVAALAPVARPAEAHAVLADSTELRKSATVTPGSATRLPETASIAAALSTLKATLTDTPALPADPSAPAQPVAPAAPASPTPSAQSLTVNTTNCPESSNTSINSHSDDDNKRSLTATFGGGDCSVRINAIGDVTFDANLRDVTVGRGGEFEVTEKRAGHIRRYRAWNDDGTVRRSFVLDGREQPVNDDVRSWLSGMLLQLERRSAFAAKSRVHALFESGGATAVLNEISQLSGDYARQTYFHHLYLEGINFDAGLLTKAARQAAREISSDYSRAEVLIETGKQRYADDNVRAAILEGAATMKSDYERRRVLTAGVPSGMMTREMARSYLKSVSVINSDYEAAEALIAARPRIVLDDAIAPDFASAIEHIGSDYENRRVLMAYVGKESTPKMLAAALRSAKGIDSDYEAAELLVKVSDRALTDPVSRAAYFEVMKTIGSDYEKRRVLTTVVKGPGFDVEAARVVLDAAATIGSDYDESELLILVAKTIPIDERLRPAYMKAADSVGGEYEYGKVMAAIRNRAARGQL